MSEVSPLLKYAKAHEDWKCLLITHDEEESAEEGIPVVDKHTIVSLLLKKTDNNWQKETNKEVKDENNKYDNEDIFLLDDFGIIGSILLWEDKDWKFLY